jgi:hypothetical protein
MIELNFFFLNISALEDQTMHFIEKSGTNHQVTPHHIARRTNALATQLQNPPKLAKLHN